MDLASLPQIILAIAEKRSLSKVMESIVGEVARQPNVALARVWLCESSTSCPVCTGKHGGEEVALHLHASAGSPREVDEDWSLLNGKFHQIPLSSDLEIAQVARSGNGLRVGAPNGDALMKWDMEWVGREALQGLCVRPLISKGEVLGVLGVFRRNPADDVCWKWLGVLADTAAVAISNARANEQADSLRRELERERDYLREEVIEVGAFGEILGKSPALERVLREVELVASTDANVLILGESGSGKELIARAIHPAEYKSQEAPGACELRLYSQRAL